MKKNKKSVRGLIRLAVVLVVLILFVFGMWMLVNYFMDENKPEIYFIDTRNEQALNTHLEDAWTVGWIRVQGTNIDYPIIYETVDAYNSGQPYTWTYHVPDQDETRMVILGHNVQNVSYDPIITDPTHKDFEQLMSFAKYDFAKDNFYIQISIPGEGEALYKIYAVSFRAYTDDTTDYYKKEDKEELKKYIEEARNKSIYDYDVDVNENDDLIALVTCTRYFGYDGETQFRVDARRVREDEKIVSYDVATTENYGIIE